MTAHAFGRKTRKGQTMATTLVTGCNRGIGLELVKQLKARGDAVIGVCRQTCEALEQVGARVIAGIDVADGDSIAQLKHELGDEPLDTVINNAGILRRDAFGSLDYEEMLELFRVNALGPLRVTEALADNLRTGSKVAIVTSRVGSIDDNGSGGNWGYRASKAAVNMIGTNLMHEFKPRGIAVALLHPGLVATDMTGQQGISPEDSARGLIERIDELNLENSGTFWHAEGYVLPW
jgi:NAD(P)-dependent dehydrogenase (short-subunit alcohol dehydrogenase family)